MVEPKEEAKKSRRLFCANAGEAEEAGEAEGAGAAGEGAAAGEEEVVEPKRLSRSSVVLATAGLGAGWGAA